MFAITNNDGVMTTTTRPEDFSSNLVSAVRAEMGRRGKTIQELTEALGLSRPTVSGRLNGHTPFTAKELDEVARFLGITAYDLIASAELGSRFAVRADTSDVSAFVPPVDPFAQPARSSRRKAGA
jgi:transcriptional regulator with XRE-family HTH domain